jgi:7-cyano-7-deazaguanine synthase
LTIPFDKANFAEDVKTRNRSRERICVLISGGLDSCALAAKMAESFEEVWPVYMEEGLLWEATELHWLEKFLARLNSPAILPLKRIALPIRDLYNDHWSTTGEQVPNFQSSDQEVYLPGRNLLLLAKTAVYCALNQISIVAMGLLKGNPFSDSTPAFLKSFAESVETALGQPLRILTPFSEYSKSEVIAFSHHLPLHLSFSCIHPAGLFHCGACNKCAERRRSFKSAEVDDITEYSALPQLG